MNLRIKTLLIVSTALLVLITGSYLVLVPIVVHSFEELEAEYAQRDVERVRDSLGATLESINSKTGDWATWDDTYEFIVDPDDDYKKSNLTTNAMVQLEINCIVFVSTAGEIVTQMCVDLESEEPAKPPAGLSALFESDSPLVAHRSPQGVVKGLALLDDEVLLVASRPIITSEGEGPIRGAVIFARYMDDGEIETVSKRTHLDVSFSRLDTGKVPEDYASARARITGGGGSVTSMLGADRIAGYSVIQDIHGADAVMIRISIPRDIHDRGVETLWYMSAALAVISVFILGLLLVLLDRTVLARLHRLAGSVSSIGSSRDLSHRVPVQGGDEIATLSTSINSMLGELQKAERKLESLSLTDPLTGLWNRRHFEAQLTRQGEGPWSLIACDVDGLKLVNDTLGHRAGDELIRSASRVLREALDDTAVVCRIGGDEFSVIMPGAGVEDVDAALKAIRDGQDAQNAASSNLVLHLSMGASTSGEEISDAEGLLRLADGRMYERKLDQSARSRSSIVSAMLGTLEQWDPDTRAHSQRVLEYMRVLASATSYPERGMELLELLARFHDLGMVGIPDAILAKPASLDAQESTMVRKHCEIGSRIAEAVPELHRIAESILRHHERWDGGGYPGGIQGHEIPLQARMLSIAEAYDSMTSRNPWREPFSNDVALAEILECAGTQFDPELASAFVSAMRASP